MRLPFFFRCKNFFSVIILWSVLWTKQTLVHDDFHGHSHRGSGLITAGTLNASLARRRTAMPAPEAECAVLEHEISFEADNTALTQVNHHALWQPIIHPAAAHCNLPFSAPSRSCQLKLTQAGGTLTSQRCTHSAHAHCTMMHTAHTHSKEIVCPKFFVVLKMREALEVTKLKLWSQQASQRPEIDEVKDLGPQLWLYLSCDENDFFSLACHGRWSKVKHSSPCELVLDFD